MLNETNPIVPTTPDDVSLAIIYSNEVFLDVIDNPPLILLQRKHSGEKCPVCWDPISRNVRISNCITCFSTGYTGGYAAPVSVKSSFQTEAVQLSVEDLGITDQRLPTQGWMSNTPIIRPEDIFVDYLNNRYKILSTQQTAKGPVLLRQVFQLQNLSPKDIAYKIPTGG